jgi:hypothetical protein
MRIPQDTGSGGTRRPNSSESESLRADIRQDMQALAAYIAEHGDPAAELHELFEARDTD